jgi:hypothetical protein
MSRWKYEKTVRGKIVSRVIVNHCDRCKEHIQSEDNMFQLYVNFSSFQEIESDALGATYMSKGNMDLCGKCFTYVKKELMWDFTPKNGYENA